MYNLKNLDTMEANNKEAHLGKLHRWLNETLTSNLITYIGIIERDWDRTLATWIPTLTYHYNRYEEELIKRGYYD